MAKNLFDYGNENLEDKNNSNDYINSNLNNNAQNSKNINADNINNNFSNNNFNANNDEKLKAEAETLYEKYKDYSQQDLISEFVSSSKEKLKQGTLTQNQINSTAKALLPFLNESQKQALSQLLEQLND